MKMWIMSDLHVELTQGWDIPGPDERPDFDVAIIAGDLMPAMERGVKWLRDRFPDRVVIYSPGNHEGYRGDIDRTVEKAREAARGTNVVVLQDEAVEIRGVKFIGTTLWTDFALAGDARAGMAAASETMNDYKKIRHMGHRRRLRPIDVLMRHQQSRAFIERELLASFPGKRVVISHHAPWPGGLPQGIGAESDPASAAYASSAAMTDLIIRGRADVWVYGHTHRSDDSIVGRTRMISNAKGYGPLPGQPLWDNPMFDPMLVVEI